MSMTTLLNRLYFKLLRFQTVAALCRPSKFAAFRHVRTGPGAHRWCQTGVSSRESAEGATPRLSPDRGMDSHVNIGVRQ